MNRGFDIIVIGAGPAGLAAAAAATRTGRQVAVLDDNPEMGGQIWRANVGGADPNRIQARTFASFASSSAELFTGRQVVDLRSHNEIDAWVDITESLETFKYDRLIIATGARERFLPFPGWTSPGVYGAGGLQALVRSGYDIRGKRVVVAGSGPLLLAVAAHLKRDGAIIVSINEQAPVARLAKFAAGLIMHPAKIRQGIALRASLGSVPYRAGSWPLEVQSSGAITHVRLTDGNKIWSEQCDLLAYGFHLVPNIELAVLRGCSVNDGVVLVDKDQCTSIESVYCAGEPTGIAGLDAALLQGEIAGLAAAGMADQAAKLHGRRNTQSAFGRRMTQAFALRKELSTLAAPDTVICRCEDVRLSQLKEQASPECTWTDAKLQTRCGMGPCQGRVCGPALETIFGWRNLSIRPPLFPVPIAAMCSAPLRNEDPIPASMEPPL
jgi:NADPH-dependent 2,4-dienoyl-CoA reductase/sulfur reductase-like enzyme